MAAGVALGLGVVYDGELKGAEVGFCSEADEDANKVVVGEGPIVESRPAVVEGFAKLKPVKGFCSVAVFDGAGLPKVKVGAVACTVGAATWAGKGDAEAEAVCAGLLPSLFFCQLPKVKSRSGEAFLFATSPGPKGEVAEVSLCVSGCWPNIGTPEGLENFPCPKTGDCGGMLSAAVEVNAGRLGP